MEPQLGIKLSPNCYGESRPSDDEDDHHIDIVNVEGKEQDDGLVKLVDQYMPPLAPEFEAVSVDNQYE